MNYDGMNVHQLMEKAVDVGTQYGHAVWKDGCEEMDALESALRKAVVREASVGVGTVRRAGEAPLPDAPQVFVPWETKDGDYDLIPHKETPMMEITSEKWCYCRNNGHEIIEGRPFNNMCESDFSLYNECGHPVFGVDIVEDAATYQPLRCLAYLATYPYGGAVTITAKDAPQ